MTSSVLSAGAVSRRLENAALRLPRTVFQWAVMALSVAVMLAMFADARHQPLVDYAAYVVGARTLLSDGSHLYAPALAWSNAGFSPLAPAAAPSDGFPFVYPPAFALGFAPLTLLPEPLASSLWLLGILGCLVASVSLLVGLVFPVTGRTRLLSVLALSAAVVLFHPVRAILVTGQADAVLILLSTLALHAFVRRRDTRAGMWLALAVCIKPTLGFLVLYLLWKRAFRAVAVTCMLALPLLVLPFVMAGGLNGLRDYVEVASYWSGPSFAVSPVNQSPYGMLLRLFTVNAFTSPAVVAPALASVLRYGLAGCSLVLLALSIRRTREVPSLRAALEYALVTVAMLVAGPLSEPGNYGYLVLALIPLTAAAVAEPARWPRLATVAAVAAVYAYLSLPNLVTLDMAFYSFWQEPVGMPRLLLTGMHLYGLVALAVLTTMTLWRNRGGDTAAIHTPV